MSQGYGGRPSVVTSNLNAHMNDMNNGGGMQGNMMGGGMAQGATGQSSNSQQIGYHQQQQLNQMQQ